MSFLTRATWAAERVLHAASGAVSGVARSAAKRITSSITVQPFQPQNEALWNVAQILEALALHEEGDFSRSAILARAFGRDDRISSCKNTRIRALIGRNGASFQLNPSTEGNRRYRRAVALRAQKLWSAVVTETALWGILEQIIDLGVSVSRIHWGRVGREWRPLKIEPWPMEYVRWDQLRGCYLVQTADQGEVETRGGSGEWLVVEPAGAQSYMAGAVRALAMPFFYRGCTWKDFARWCEKHGVPILAITEPANDPAAFGGSGQTSKQTFFARLKRIGREGILRLPWTDENNKYDAKILEPKAMSWAGFKEFLLRLDVCIAVYLLGQNLSTEVSGGSFAAALAQNRVRLDYLAADAEAISSAIRTQLLMPWGRFNFDWWDDALAPWPQWNTAAPEDLKAKSETFDKAATAYSKFKASGVPLDTAAYCEMFGVPLGASVANTQEPDPEAEADAEDDETDEEALAKLAWLDAAA